MGGLGGVLSILLTTAVFPQAVPYAHSFSKSAEEVEVALKDLQAYSGQKLPIVDGFVATGDKPLNQYERAFYQFSIDVLPGTGGGTVVRVTAKLRRGMRTKIPRNPVIRCFRPMGDWSLISWTGWKKNLAASRRLPWRARFRIQRSLLRSRSSILGPSLVCKFRRRQILRQNPEPRQMNWARCDPIVKPKKTHEGIERELQGLQEIQKTKRIR